ncbi:helix-turn-helix domain-containing protein [Phenylobacterium sp.]|uniref:helix-turn-helix domain-containing protein n=1 Tax=Phenylobacterium sp. TaxID=1871053 RepID=UPI0025D200D8|nr:helix-turn-helix transcriptional regulator [Phenylobacterium sp.]
MSLRALLARNLRRLRQAQSLSQEELAARADITANYLSSLEREEYAASWTSSNASPRRWTSRPASFSRAIEQRNLRLLGSPQRRA